MASQSYYHLARSDWGAARIRYYGPRARRGEWVLPDPPPDLLTLYGKPQKGDLAYDWGQLHKTAPIPHYVLAYTILLHRTRQKRLPLKLYRTFAADFLPKIPPKGGYIDVADIDAWLVMKRLEVS